MCNKSRKKLYGIGSQIVVLTAQYSLLWGSCTEHLSWEHFGRVRDLCMHISPSTGAALLAEFFVISRSEMFGG